MGHNPLLDQMNRNKLKLKLNSLLPTMTVIVTSGAKFKSCSLSAMPQNTVHERILHDTGTLKTAVKRMLQWAC